MCLQGPRWCRKAGQVQSSGVVRYTRRPSEERKHPDRASRSRERSRVEAARALVPGSAEGMPRGIDPAPAIGRRVVHLIGAPEATGDDLGRVEFRTTTGKALPEAAFTAVANGHTDADPVRHWLET